MNEVNVSQTGVNPVAHQFHGYGQDIHQLEARLSQALRVRKAIAPASIILNKRAYLSSGTPADVVAQQVASL